MVNTFLGAETLMPSNVHRTAGRIAQLSYPRWPATLNDLFFPPFRRDIDLTVPEVQYNRLQFY